MILNENTIKELEALSFQHLVRYYKPQLLTLVREGLEASRLTHTDIKSLKRWGALEKRGWGMSHQYILSPRALEALGRREQPHRYPRGRCPPKRYKVWERRR